MVSFPHYMLLSSVLFISQLLCSVTSIQSPRAPPAVCDRSCGYHDVQYPFGFSPGCQIQLNCSGAGEMQLSGYRVGNVTSASFFVDLPLDCNRSIRAARALFGSNYAMTSNNFFILRNCNISGRCEINTDVLFGNLANRNISSCASGDGNFICYASGGGNSGVLKMHDVDIRDGAKGSCNLFTSFRYDSTASADSSLVFGSAELVWWLNGTSCDCSANAKSTLVDTAVAGQKGCRCACAEGFSGDGFRDGRGCFNVSVSASIKPHANGAIIIFSASLASLVVALVILSIIKERTISIRPFSQSNKGDGLGENEELELPLFGFKDISAATDNFCDDMMLGKGGFGFVYKGILADGKEIAVKRLSRTSSQGVEEFKNEVTLIAKLQHRNLVRLLGCCVQGEERMLVYEYLPNKSLDAFLFVKDNQLFLAWERRHQIIMGIARGLLYLHQDSNFRIIHRDLKASNVLLDEQMNPKISDFGVARMLGGDDAMNMTRKVVGTFGYMAPEYAMNGLFSAKSDIFSFGVLVLEVISGERNKPSYHKTPQDNLLGRAWSLWNQGRCLELVDPSIGPHFGISQVTRCINIGLLCAQALPEDRPMMSTVVTMLVTDDLKLPEPKETGFLTTSRLSSDNQEVHSVNYMSTTMIDAR